MTGYAKFNPPLSPLRHQNVVQAHFRVQLGHVALTHVEMILRPQHTQCPDGVFDLVRCAVLYCTVLYSGPWQPHGGFTPAFLDELTAAAANWRTGLGVWFSPWGA